MLANAQRDDRPAVLLWPPYGIGQGIIIFSFCGFFYLSFFFLFYLFSSPNLSGRRLDVCHTCEVK